MTTATHLFDAAALRDHLEHEGVPPLLLTPNRRLASRIATALAAQQGAAVVEAAPVLALGDWLEQLWQQLLFRGDPAARNCWVLGADQELCLWENAVRSNAALLREGAAAEQAARALRTLVLCRQWPLSAAARSEFEASPDCAAFLQWLAEFQRQCEQHGCISAAERDERIVQAARAGRLHLPAAVLGIGFDDMAPLYRALLAAVPAYREWAAPARNRSALCVPGDTLEQQLQAAALWVQAQLRTDPAGPFAIVVPDLSQQRALVERVLLDVLTPDHSWPDSARRLPPLNFSAGESLAQTPLVRSALQLLGLALPRAAREDLLDLLASPFHSLDQQRPEPIAACVRAVCDTQLAQLRSGQLRAIADGVAARFEGWSFAAQLQQLAERLRRDRMANARLPLSEWARHFAAWLELLGWPGTRALDSIEYQQLGLWQQVLADFGRLDHVVERCDCSAALQRLRQALQARLFQPKTPDAPVQVLGVLEAAGLQFKGLWLCDMGDDRWPQPAAPHPLLPRDMQRRLRMPRCDAMREYEIAARLSHSLLANAEQVVISFQREREEVARAPSPLFRQLPLQTLSQLLGAELDELLPLAQWRLRQRGVALQPFDAGVAPVLAAGERARGGSALFKDQAGCGFQAFAKHRLGAQPLAAVQEGLDAATRGNLLHTALEKLWREIPGHRQLLALSEPQREQHAHAAAAYALEQLQRELPQRLGERFVQLELARLSELLRRWLAVEMERGEFTVVAIEERRELPFAQLQLRVRVDRIDQLPDGRLLVIDYKTKNANCSPAHWLGERPDEPQLPLYSVLLEAERSDSVAGVLFAQVRPENPRLVGAGADDLDKHQIKAAAALKEPAVTSWEQLKTQWRAVLENLAAQFIEGRAEIDPKSAQVCQYCALGGICRIDHQLPERADEVAS